MNAIFAKIREEWGFSSGFGLPDLLRRWHEFVEEVESGYRSSVHDFVHELSLRDLLEEIGEAVPVRFRQELEANLKPLDERFWLATEPIPNPIEPVEEAREWWFRIPRVAGPDLMEALRMRHLIRGQGRLEERS